MDTVLVLNSDYSPLNVTSLRRGFVLVDKGKAEILKKGDTDIITTVGNFVRPLVIRLLNYVRYQSKGVTVNRKRIFRRDGHTFGYCGSKRNLTLDHIVPKSRGGAPQGPVFQNFCGWRPPFQTFFFVLFPKCAGFLPRTGNSVFLRRDLPFYN